MGEIEELTVTKGKTVKAADKEEWLKLEFSVTAVIQDDAELATAKAHIEGMIDGWFSSLPTATPTPKPQAAKLNKPGPELFPEDLRALLSFEEKEGYFIIRPRQFLGTENFAKIADKVKAEGGEWVSEGKNSHFRISIKSS